MGALKENCSLFVGHNGLCVSIITSSLIELFTSPISLLLFYLLDILTAERSMVQYHNDKLFFLVILSISALDVLMLYLKYI